MRGLRSPHESELRYIQECRLIWAPDGAWLGGTSAGSAGAFLVLHVVRRGLEQTVIDRLFRAKHI